MKQLPVLLFLFSLPLFAQQQPRHEVAVSGGVTYYHYSGEAPAFGASYNHFFTRVASARAGFFIAREAQYTGHGEIRFTAMHLSAEYHPFRGRRLSPRVSAGVAYAAYRNDFGLGIEEEKDSTITAIGGAGLDVNITRRFALGVEALYIPFTPNARDRFALALNPATAMASARFRW
jgi:outer membrane protein W